MRWDLVDSFKFLKKGQSSVAFKSFSGSEDFFEEHFPGKPLVPDVLFIEMIAQAGGVLYGYGIDFQREVILAKIFEATFLKAVSPPCCFEIEAHLEEEREEGGLISGTVKMGAELVARAKLLLLTIESFETDRKTQIVFSESFLKHYDIYNIAKLSGDVI